jgi:predicted alpha/beta superfamily hydrolase
MHDGQNLFDAYTSFSGEWQVDESLNTLFTHGDYGIIVVGIDNGPNRIGEYSPWINSAYGGGEGAQYVNWTVKNLKPYIDSVFRTNPTPQYTGIMGSSMGGLISQYGGIQYQQTWKKVGLLSPSFWFADSIFIQEHNIGVQKDMKFYFESGSNEDSTMVPLMVAMKDSLLKGGLDTSRVWLRTYLNGQHSEAYWALYFPIAYQYLFANLNIGTGIEPEKTTTSGTFDLFPNPASDKIYFQIGSGETLWNMQLLNINGEVLNQQKIKAQGILNTDQLPSGIYFLKGWDTEGNFAYKKFIVEH